MSVVFSGEKI